MDRPRIHFSVDRPRRAQARVARAIARQLGDEFDCFVFDDRYVAADAVPDCELLVAASWRSSEFGRLAAASERVVKIVDDEDGIEALGVAEFAERELSDAAFVLCPSEHLRRRLAPHCSVRVLPFAVDPFVFPVRRGWAGPVRFGWAGLAGDRQKGLEDVLMPAAGDDYALAVAGGDPQLAAMGAFYRSVDVFTLASTHEGAPLTLLEAMASGCFPVCTDVGLVPELIRHGENGLIVERSVEAFREAFAWCVAHPRAVRRAGADNAEWVRQRRTWPHVAESWRGLFREVITSWIPAPAVRAVERPSPLLPVRASS